MALGGGKDIFLDRSEQEDEQGLRKVMCERRSALVYAVMSRLMVRRLTHL